MARTETAFVKSRLFFSKVTTRFPGWAPVTGSVALMVMIALVSAISFAQLKTSNFWREHSYQVLATAQTFRVNFFSILRAVHEYALTGQSTALENSQDNAPVVRGDRALLRQVLVNLISNALKFTGARSEAAIEIGCAPDGDAETVIYVRDNGAGFDPKYTDKLFGVFQRLHSQEEFEGTGIGLANVQRIIKRHGGRAWAEGIVDGGATLYFSIPKQISSNAG
jgi:light-regulated signal transduction histidine kinase (bacteriophytochrome)